MQKIAK